MSTRKSDQDAPQPLGWREVALWAVLFYLSTLAVYVALGIGFASRSSIASFASMVLGCLLIGIVGTVAVVYGRRPWPIIPVFLACGFVFVAVVMSAPWYLSAHGKRVTATVTSVSCHSVKGGGVACTLGLRGPDGTTLDDLTTGRHKVGDTVDVVYDPVGLFAQHTRDDVDSVNPTLVKSLLGASAGLLAVLVAVVAVDGERTRIQGRDPIAGTKFDPRTAQRQRQQRQRQRQQRQQLRQHGRRR